MKLYFGDERLTRLEDELHHCDRCNQDFPMTEFTYREYKDRAYIGHVCRECRNKQGRDIRAIAGDAYNERKRQDRRLRQAVYKDRDLRKMYNITLAEYDDMLLAQNGVCAICHGVNPGEDALSVDHDHRCCPGKKSCGGCVRGLLCRKCNTGLGAFDDNVALLELASSYLIGEQ